MRVLGSGFRIAPRSLLIGCRTGFEALLLIESRSFTRYHSSGRNFAIKLNSLFPPGV